MAECSRQFNATAAARCRVFLFFFVPSSTSSARDRKTTPERLSPASSFQLFSSSFPYLFISFSGRGLYTTTTPVFFIINAITSTHVTSVVDTRPAAVPDIQQQQISTTSIRRRRRRGSPWFDWRRSHFLVAPITCWRAFFWFSSRRNAQLSALGRIPAHTDELEPKKNVFNPTCRQMSRLPSYRCRTKTHYSTRPACYWTTIGTEANKLESGCMAATCPRPPPPQVTIDVYSIVSISNACTQTQYGQIAAAPGVVDSFYQ